MIEKVKNGFSNPSMVYYYIYNRVVGETIHDWTARTTSIPRDTVEGYLSEFAESEEFEQLERKCRKIESEEGSSMQSALDKSTNLFLYSLVRSIEPDVVVETGVAHGVSTTILLAALERNGHGNLYSIDLPNVRYGESISILSDEQEPGWLVPESLAERWHFRLGDSREELPELTSEIENIDVFFHDSDHTFDLVMFECERVWPVLSQGGYVVIDDAVRNNGFEEFIQGNTVSAAWPPKSTTFGAIKK